MTVFGNTFGAPGGGGFPSLPAGEGVGGRIFASGQPLFIGDARRDPRVLGPFLGDQGIASMLGVPLRTRDRLVGILHVDWREPHAESASDLHLLETAAERCAAAIVNAQLFEELRAQADRYRNLQEFHENVVAGSAAAIAATNGEGRFTSVNPAFAALVGREASSLLGCRASEVLPADLSVPQPPATIQDRLHLVR